MGKKRKTARSEAGVIEPVTSKYHIEERFDESRDEFYAGRDRILLDEGPAAKRRRRIEEQERDIQLSDEEVFEHAESDGDLDDMQSKQDTTEESESEDETWGTTKADYYNADIIETEADALDEEKEARRLQQKQLKSMTDADFGFDDMTWTQQEQKTSSGPVVQKLPEARLPNGASKEELTEVLYTRYPEFGLLARDLVELQVVWNQLQEQVVAYDQSKVNGVTVRTKLSALTSYLGAIAMYFAIISSTPNPKSDVSKITALPPSELRDHVVIDNLMSSRRLWDTVKGMKDAQPDEPISAAAGLSKKVGEKPRAKAKGKASSNGRKTSKQEIRELSSDIDDMEFPPMPTGSEKKRKTRLLDLQSLLDQSAVPQIDDASDFGDEAPLTMEQAEEKARKKKSLRFYTSQIAQKANKRGAASREAGGDDDVPRKERLRDKQERLLKEAEKRGLQKATAQEELGGDSDEEIPENRGDDYYESLVADSKRKKANKQAKAEAYAEAARQGAQVYEEEQIGADGKRRITYAIEKNKGLAPKRKKDVRNPRVKKRKKYDEKMKKLSSVRQVYKGGEGRGGYGGELTGIKTNIVKSVKL